MGFEFDGMDKFRKQIENIQKQAQEAVSGEVKLDDLFSESFMEEYTGKKSIQEFIDESPLAEENLEEADQLDTPEMDEYVRDKTEFESWQDFIQAATNDYAAEMLKNAGFKLG